MKFNKTRSSEMNQGPSSTLGIMRFFDVEVGGPKVGPEFILGVTIAFALLIIVVKLSSGI